MTNAIEASGLVKRFGKTTALAGVDLGPNGAGKTTAVRILATLLQSDGGQARVCGYDLDRQAHQVRRVAGDRALQSPSGWQCGCRVYHRGPHHGNQQVRTSPRRIRHGNESHTCPARCEVAVRLRSISAPKPRPRVAHKTA